MRNLAVIAISVFFLASCSHHTDMPFNSISVSDGLYKFNDTTYFETKGGITIPMDDAPSNNMPFRKSEKSEPQYEMTTGINKCQINTFNSYSLLTLIINGSKNFPVSLVIQNAIGPKNKIGAYKITGNIFNDTMNNNLPSNNQNVLFRENLSDVKDYKIDSATVLVTNSTTMTTEGDYTFWLDYHNSKKIVHGAFCYKNM